MVAPATRKPAASSEVNAFISLFTGFFQIPDHSCNYVQPGIP
jgi:hypothetical protein